MNRLKLLIAAGGMAALGTALVAGAALAQPKGDVVHGKKIYISYGCYQCHGYQGQGGASSGPKLAPNPLPYDALDRQMRKPRDRMPVYTHKTVSDADVADIYAYLLSVPKAKTVAEIPLLK